MKKILRCCQIYPSSFEDIFQLKTQPFSFYKKGIMRCAAFDEL